MAIQTDSTGNDEYFSETRHPADPAARDFDGVPRNNRESRSEDEQRRKSNHDQARRDGQGHVAIQSCAAEVEER